MDTIMDQRWQALAQILVEYSVAIQPNERVLITMMEIETFPLARAVFSQAVRVGAYPYIEFQSTFLERDLLQQGNDEQISWIPEMMEMGMKWADVYIGLRGSRNPHELSNINSKKIALRKRAMGEISALREAQTRCVLIRVPNESLAQQAKMSSDDMMEFFFNATIRDWTQESQQARDLARIFESAESVHKGTDLKFSTQGRKYRVGAGHHNMPDGEIFTAPVDNSAEGKITFEFPGVYSGQLIEDISLEFDQGQVTNATSSTNQDLLSQLVSMDEGSCRLGEFGVGTNFGITKYCYDILYDEKIGGTVHLALGRAYPACGGINKSALHWDIIKDLREEGAVYLDGRKVMENGRFLIKLNE
jgi:aminopeptidase